MNAHLHIRHGVPEDASMLAELGARAFAQTFSRYNTPEDMADYLAKSFSPAIQASELSTPGCTFLIIEQEGPDGKQAFGFARLQTGPAPTCITGVNPIELVRIYLLEEWIGHGEGSKLMQASIDEASRTGHDVVWLGVWEKNPRAIAFYEKWGFRIAGSHDFLLGSDLQTDNLMQRMLV